jgi:hypothetical protein
MSIRDMGVIQLCISLFKRRANCRIQKKQAIAAPTGDHLPAHDYFLLPGEQSVAGIVNLTLRMPAPIAVIGSWATFVPTAVILYIWAIGLY